jgi:hypothetical protein
LFLLLLLLLLTGIDFFSSLLLIMEGTGSLSIHLLAALESREPQK